MCCTDNPTLFSVSFQANLLEVYLFPTIAAHSLTDRQTDRHSLTFEPNYPGLHSFLTRPDELRFGNGQNDHQREDANLGQVRVLFVVEGFAHDPFLDPALVLPYLQRMQ